MSITTQYRGYTIRFSENEDKWGCFDIGFSHASLSKVKAKIDRLHLDMRKAAAIDAVHLGLQYSGGVETADARVIDYRLRRERDYSSLSSTGHIEIHEVAAMYRRGLSDQPGKNWIKVDSLAPLGPATDAALAVVRAASEEVRAAQERLREAWAAVPRLTLDDIKGLIAAAEARIDEADE